MEASVVSIVYKPQGSADPADHYARIPLDNAQLVEGYGIEGDSKGGHPKRQLNVMSLEAVQWLAGQGFKTAPGELGEQLVISGVDVASLAEGDRLQLGDSACIEVIKLRTGCDRFEHIQGKSREDAARRMGVMAVVVTGGAIQVGDAVKIVQQV